MLWHLNARVNSHQRWKQTRFRVCFHLWCELTNTMNVTEWRMSWNSWMGWVPVLIDSTAPTSALAPPQPCHIMFLMGVFAPALGSPSWRIEISSSLEPEFSNFFRSWWDPSKGLALTSSYFTRHKDTLVGITGMFTQQMATEAFGLAAHPLAVMLEVWTPPANVDSWKIENFSKVYM